MCTDASAVIAATCVYLKLTDEQGRVKCGLLAAKSKLISKLTVPRAELRACTMGACLAAVVQKALGERVKKTTFVTDSVVSLSWLNTDQRPLQVGVRNAVIQIRRFSTPAQWFHVPSAENLADIGTRGASPAEIGAGSDWQTGREWMYNDLETGPVRSLHDIEVSNEERVAVNAEIRNSGLQGIVLNVMEGRLTERYHHSLYIIDPCAWPWPKFLRKLAVLIRVANCFKTYKRETGTSVYQLARCEDKFVVSLSDEDLKAAENYVFKLATSEVKKFNDVTKLRDIVEKDGILMFSGRILDGMKPSDPFNLMGDIQPLSFISPVID